MDATFVPWLLAEANMAGERRLFPLGRPQPEVRRACSRGSYAPPQLGRYRIHLRRLRTDRLVSGACRNDQRLRWAEGLIEEDPMRRLRHALKVDDCAVNVEQLSGSLISMPAVELSRSKHKGPPDILIVGGCARERLRYYPATPSGGTRSVEPIGGKRLGDAQQVLDIVLGDQFPRLALSDRDLDPMVPASIEEKHEVRLTFVDIGSMGSSDIAVVIANEVGSCR